MSEIATIFDCDGDDAICLPDGMGFGIGTDLEIERIGNCIVLRRLGSPPLSAEERIALIRRAAESPMT